MTNTHNLNKTAIVGVCFGSEVFYNIIENEPEFEFTGLAIINWLTHDNNRFISQMIQGQSYETIVRILDDEFERGQFISHSNKNSASMQQLYSFISGESNVSHVYVYDVFNDVLLVKTPEVNNLTALDYTNSFDVREFRNSLRW